MEVKEVDPSKVTVDPMNERQDGTADEEFVENVKATGIIQPPLVRPLDDGMDASMGAEYAVVVGGRRVDAATQADLDSIPVYVVDWDDDDALLASIVENIDAFHEEVDSLSRAVAVDRFKKLGNLKNKEVAEHLGVAENTVSRWLEPLEDEWEGTSFQPDVEIENPPEVDSVAPVSDRSVNVKTMRQARLLTGGGEAGEKVMEIVQEAGLSEEDVKKARKRFDDASDKTTVEIVEEVAKEKKQREEQKANGSIVVHTRTTFTGDYANAIKKAAEDRSASDDQIVRAAVSQWLEQEGYL